jgi:hypothetical protein
MYLTFGIQDGAYSSVVGSERWLHSILVRLWSWWFLRPYFRKEITGLSETGLRLGYYCEPDINPVVV